MLFTLQQIHFQIQAKRLWRVTMHFARYLGMQIREIGDSARSFQKIIQPYKSRETGVCKIAGSVKYDLVMW